MPYIISRFSSDVTGFVVLPILNYLDALESIQALPPYSDQYDIGVPDSKPVFTKLLNGAVAFSGPRRGSSDVPYEWPYKGMIIVPNAAAFESSYDVLAAAAHTRGRIWRRNESATKWHNKRVFFKGMDILRQHDTIYRFGNPYLCMDVEMRFEVIDALWQGLVHGGGIVLDTGPGFDIGYALDYDPNTDRKTLTGTTTNWAYVVGGTRDQPEIWILITVGASDLTSLTLENTTTGTAFTYTGTVPATRQLLISTRGRVEHLASSSSGFAANVTTIAVDSTTKATPGGTVSIVLTNGETYATTVATVVNGTTFTIPSPGLPSAASSGARVGFGGYWGASNTRLFTNRRPQWFTLTPGTNNLVMTRVGGGSGTVVGLSFREAH